MDLDRKLEGFADYANDDVRALFNSFNTDEDRIWAWEAIRFLLCYFPNLKHIACTINRKSICITNKDQILNTKEYPIFCLDIEAKSRTDSSKGGGAALWIIKKYRQQLLSNPKNWWITSNNGLDALEAWIKDLSKDSFSEHVKSSNSSQGYNMPLNTILYGPPGTGKTYHTINKALEIIDPDFYSLNKDKREALKKRFDNLCEENKIVMTTFHQSYAYEDFVEGLSAESIDGKLVYGLKDGVFKTITQNANNQKTSNFDEIYTKFCNDIEENGLTLKTLKRNKSIDIEVSTQQNLVVIPQTETKTRMTITKENLKQFILSGVIGDWRTYTRVIKKHLEDEYHLVTHFQSSNYVLIIDEINRGNVSNIFGELITLIEDSKRAGKDEALSVTLPYSKDHFSVPSNLYIVGTMNTADRSLTQIDTALRRRFHFEEMMPDSSLLKDIDINGIDIRKLLECLNKRIEALYDREHTLGHAFFMELIESDKQNIDTLAAIFKNKIIPLLQEYFFDDWGKIQLILGEQVIKEKVQFSNFATSNTNNIVIPKAYEIVSETLEEPDTYITMYKNCLSM